MDMDYKEDIEQILERYFECETTVEEESRLRSFFTADNVPQHLLRYKDLFVYQQIEHDICLGDDFDRRILARIEPPKVKARTVSLTSRFMPLCKAAAIVAMVVGVGNMMQHSFFTDTRHVAVTDTIGKEISAPSVALSVNPEQAGSIEQQLIDSLRKAEHQVEAQK